MNVHNRGAFRGGELVPKEVESYDSRNTLLRQDMWISKLRVDGKKVEMLSVRLKSAKSARASERGQVVEVFSIESVLCPVRAVKKYLELAGRNPPNIPMFRREDGLCYSHSSFNADLKKLLREMIPYGGISAHSFRIGMATLLAQSGYSDDEICAIGRWNSEAFRTYIRGPKVTRVAISRKLAKEAKTRCM